MATFLASPMSADSYHPNFHKRNSVANIAHLSGITIMNPEAYLATIQDASPAHPPPKMQRESKQSSYASTTKSQIRQSNHQFLETLQNIHEELVIHRSIMTDIQSRILTLELRPALEFKVSSPPTSLATYESCSPPSRKVSNVGRECYSSWGARQNPVPLQMLDTTTATRPASGYLRTPRRFSGFDFNFDTLKQKLNTPPRTPEVPESDASGLILASEIHQGPEVAATYKELGTRTRRIRPNSPASPISELPSESWEHYQEESDIIEHVIEFDMISVPRPPILESPPRSLRSKPVSTPTSREDNITALPVVPPSASTMQSPQACHKGFRSLIQCTATLKRKMMRRESA